MIDSVVQFTTQLAEYAWERYQVNITYKWGRYTKSTQTVTKYAWSASGFTQSQYSRSYTVYPSTNITITLAKNFSDNERSASNAALNKISDSVVGASAAAEMLQKYIGYYWTSMDYGPPGNILHSLSVSDVRAQTSSDIRYKLISVSEGYESITLTWKNECWQISSTTTETIRGSYIDDVTSTSASAYPSNGASGDYWYVSNGSETSRGNYVDIVSSVDYNAYPNDGIQDGYWYTKN